jgi:hypothetical protein
MSYEQKYLKYKQKYLELKKQLEMNGGALSTTNDISVNTESVLNLSETPRQQTGGFLGLFKDSQSTPSVETELNLTETPGAPAAPEPSNQKMYTEVNLGPESNMKNVVLSDTPTQEQVGAGFFNGLFDNAAPAPQGDQPCPGTVNPVPEGVVGSETMAAAQEAAAQAAAEEAARVAAEQAAAEEAARVAAEQAAAEEAARVAAEQAAAEEAARVAAEQAAAEEAARVAAEQAAAEEAARVAAEQAAAEQAAEQAVAQAATEQVAAPVEAVPATSKYSVGNSEINNTEDIEKLFSQLGGNYSELNDLVDASSSSIFSTESDLSLTISEDDLLEQL